MKTRPPHTDLLEKNGSPQTLDEVLEELDARQARLAQLTEEHHKLRNISQPPYRVRCRMYELTDLRRHLYFECLALECLADDLGHSFED